MSDYRLNFESIVSSNDAERLYNLLPIVSNEDQLEITLGSDDPMQIDMIIDVLQGNDFKVLTRRSDKGDECHIIAHRLS